VTPQHLGPARDSVQETTAHPRSPSYTKLREDRRLTHIGREGSGDRVALHYPVACGECESCSRGYEQFCRRGAMVGHGRDGGWAEYVVVPERNLVGLPPDVSYAHGAVLMCAGATSLHALRRARLVRGETVAIFGVGGLGMLAIQLARALGAADVYAIDLDSDKLASAHALGAIPIDAGQADPVETLRFLTRHRGVDVALELIGLSLTIQQAIRSVGIHGRTVVAGLASHSVEVDTYRDLLANESELMGANDHLLSELPFLLHLAQQGAISLSHVVRREIRLDADAVNGVLDALDNFVSPVRTVIVS
jgi:D-arabinose 1-dehydrogenase-like Zn-dependent alcohol dehydrogenase